MSIRGRQTKGRKRAQQLVRLATGAGSAAAVGLEAPEGFQREHVLDVEGRPSTVIRRIDNLGRLTATLGGEILRGVSVAINGTVRRSIVKFGGNAFVRISEKLIAYCIGTR